MHAAIALLFALLLALHALPCLAQDLDGGPGDDALAVGASDAYANVHGGMGADTITNHGIVNVDIFGGDGVTPGDGNDSIVNSYLVHGSIYGEDGDDILRNTYWGEIDGSMLGGGGNDSLYNDGIVGFSLDGGAGNDMLVNEYWGEIYGDMDGGDDDDSLSNYGLVVGSLLGGAGDDVLYNAYDTWIDGDMDGGDGDDVLTNYDMVQGGLMGGDGNDVISNLYSEWGGAGFILGGSGNDEIINSGYVDLGISGGDGNDVLRNIGLGDTLWMYGDDGDDIIVHSGDYMEEICGDAGNDDITVTSDVWGFAVGDEGAGNIGGTSDVLRVSGGVWFEEGFGEFESIVKTGPGSVAADVRIELDGADVSVEMFESAAQFVTPSLTGVGGDLTVAVMGGRWADGQVVNIFSTGPDAGWGLETISDGSTFLDFTLLDGQVTAVRVADYIDFVDPGDPNARRMADLLNDLVNNGSGDLDLLFSILDFMDPSRLSELLDQLGPTLGGAMQDRSFAASQLMWSVLANRPSLGGSGGTTGLTLSLSSAGGASNGFDLAAVSQLSQGFAQVMQGRSAPDEDLARALENGQALGKGLVLADSLALGAAADSELGPMLALTSRDMSVWMRLMVQGLESEEHGDSTAYDATLLGVAAGLDIRLSEHWQAGVHLGLSGQDLKLDDAGGSSASGRTMQLGASLGYANGPLALEATLGGYNGWWSTERRILYGALDRTAEADVNALGVAASLGGEYDFQVGDVHLTPMARAEFLYQRQAAYTESGAGDLNLRVDAGDSTSLRTSLGGRISADLEIDAGRRLIAFTPAAHALWRHEFMNDSREISCEFTGGGSFESATPDPDRDTLLLGAGITLGRQDSPSFYLTGDVELGANSVGYGGAVGFRIPF